ncbi:MAG: HEPN domain-containing protein [Planctomycetes bacterium]|nr:HEPN domain-containing protein [Planctomycetota bacterium]
MSDEASVWLQYARENLQVAQMTLESGLLNPCLQNAQQAIEKALKGVLVCRNMPLKRTHSIRDLNRDLLRDGWETNLAEEDCELLDSIYVSSKYPLDSVLPHSLPDLDICRRCVELANQTVILAESVIET